MDCILHIGVEKTGTTAIQRFLVSNRSRLLSSGILYPQLTGHGAHAPLCVASYGHFRGDDLCNYSHVADEAQWQSCRSTVLDAIRHESVNARAQGATTMIFSSEHIQSRLRSMEELANLKRLLEEAEVGAISILVYLRDPVEIAASLYSTAVKFGSKAQNAPPPSDPYYHNICDHRGTLDRFSSVFGAEALKPRLFHRSHLAGGSVIEDFCDALRLPTAGFEIAPGSSNRSLSDVGIGILARLNEAFPVFVDGHYNPYRQMLIDRLERDFHDPPYRLIPEMTRRYEEAFRESNQWVHARYFPHREVLFPKSERRSNIANDLSAVELDLLANEICEQIKAAG